MTRTYTVTRSTHVDGPPQEVYDRIVDLQRWPAWSPYEKLDPGMTKSYSGPTSGVGAAYEWSGNMKAGTGRMQIVEAVEPEKVGIDLAFTKPFRSSSVTTFTIAEAGDGSDVTWAVTGPVNLMARGLGVFSSPDKAMDKLMGGAFEEGLANLKADVEKG